MKKEYTNHILVGISLLFLLGIFWFGGEARKNNQTFNQVEEIIEKIDVEISESELMSDDLESEIEGYLEDDVSSLDVNNEEQNDRVNEEEEVALDGNITQPSPSILPLVKRENGPDELRIGFMTDPHIKSNSGPGGKGDRILKPFFVGVLSYFIERMNNVFVPDFLIINGDVIEGTGRDNIVGFGELSSTRKLFDRTLLPKYWVVGNHDLRAVNKKEWMDSLGIDYLYKSFDVRNYRIIILDSNFDEEDKDIVPGKYFTRGNVSKKQIDWLEKELETDKKKIVFIHNPPLWNVDVRDNSGLLLNALELQEIFQKNKVTAVFSGHIEDLYYDKIGGVKYFVLPGVIKNEKYQGTFAEISIVGDKIELDVSYKVGEKYRRLNLKEILD